MKRSLILTALLLSCSSLWAADVEERWRISILAAEISASSSNTAGWSQEPHAGVSVGVAYAPTPQWDVELTVASQTHRSPYLRLFYVPNPSGNVPGQIYPATEFREYRVMPVDFSVTRHFLAGQPVMPYVRAGVRYVDAPDDPASPIIVTSYGTPQDPQFIPVHEGFGFRERTSVQAGAGVQVRMTPRTALRAEVTRLLRSDEADFDPLTRCAIGVSWKF